MGLAAVQLARLRHAEIYGTASASKHAFLQAQGVHHTIDSYHHDLPTVIHGLTGGRGLDIVLDPLGGRSFAQSYKMLAPLGRLLLFGASRMSPVCAAIAGWLSGTSSACPGFIPCA